MIKRALALLTVIIVAFATPASAQILMDDPSIPDTVYIDSITAYTNSHGVVPVSFVNDETLAGIELTLTWDSPDIHLDSFSFVGGRADYVSIKGVFNLTGGISIYCLPLSGEPVIAPGSGLFGNLYFSWPLSIDEQLVTIDTVTILNGDVEYSTVFSDEESNAFKPMIEEGYLDIKQGFGCCIGMRGNVDNSPDETPNIADLTYLVDFLFTGGPPPDCPEEADLNAELGPDPNIVDLTYLVQYLFQGGPDPAPCR